MVATKLYMPVPPAPFTAGRTTPNWPGGQAPDPVGVELAGTDEEGALVEDTGPDVAGEVVPEPGVVTGPEVGAVTPPMVALPACLVPELHPLAANENVIAAAPAMHLRFQGPILALPLYR